MKEVHPDFSSGIRPFVMIQRALISQWYVSQVSDNMLRQLLIPPSESEAKHYGCFFLTEESFGNPDILKGIWNILKTL